MPSEKSLSLIPCSHIPNPRPATKSLFRTTEILQRAVDMPAKASLSGKPLFHIHPSSMFSEANHCGALRNKTKERG